MAFPQIAIIGATGNVGRIIVEQLLSQGIPASSLSLVASEKSSGQAIEISGTSFVIKNIQASSWKKSNIFLLATKNEVSKIHVPELLKTGGFVLDASSAYRLKKDVPLIVYPINGHLVKPHQRFYTHSNCIASPLSLILSPLESLDIKHLHVATYQSISGAGARAMAQFMNHTHLYLELEGREILQSTYFPRPMGLNVIPEIGEFLENESTGEEHKIVQEIQKILEIPIPVFVTSVRVPVLRGHSFSIWAECAQAVTQKKISTLLSNAPCISVSSQAHTYKTPLEIIGQDNVFVGRIRTPTPNIFQMWACSDNLRRGAATDITETTLRIFDFFFSKKISS